MVEWGIRLELVRVVKMILCSLCYTIYGFWADMVLASPLDAVDIKEVSITDIKGSTSYAGFECWTFAGLPSVKVARYVVRDCAFAEDCKF